MRITRPAQYQAASDMRRVLDFGTLRVMASMTSHDLPDGRVARHARSVGTVRRSEVSAAGSPCARRYARRQRRHVTLTLT